MKALIKPVEYFDKNILEKENKLVFGVTWNFVCFSFDLENENDFVTTTIGGQPVVVQNLGGEIRAFKNVCSHRHSIIQTEPKGNRSLMCPYHGWAYDKKGIPRGIPKKPLFKFAKQELECLKLREFKLETCGSLIFVSVSNEVLSLRDFFGDLFLEVELMSNSFGRLVDVNQLQINANWKILVENTLESYHVNLVHERTFKRLGARGLGFQFINDHSVWNASLKTKEDTPKRVHKPFRKRPYKIEGYKHLICFPNVLISSTYGISFNLSIISPIDEKSSLFRSYVFMTKTEAQNTTTPLTEIYEKSLIDFNRQVFDEDKEICEQVQVGVNFSEYDGELSEEEERVCEFQKAYKQYINNDGN